MADHHQVVNHFIRKLMDAITRSPLLHMSVSRTGRFLDCSRLGSVQAGLAERLLRNVVCGGRATTIDLSRLRDDGGLLDGGRRNRDLQKDFSDLLDRRMRRHAEAIRRELGVHILWLAYPLLYVRSETADPESDSTLAPVFLWPVQVDTDLRKELHFRVERLKESGSPSAPKFNQAMAAWVYRRLNVRLDEPTEDDLQSLTWPKLQEQLKRLAEQFANPPVLDSDRPLRSVPQAPELREAGSPSLFNCAVLGCFRWQNQAILADLEDLRKLSDIDGVAGAFTSGKQLPRSSPLPPPPETDRYLVLESDFSQEQVIWCARQEPGVVVHGPPGTGKSQTIVNIIADNLARGESVLMVCQKQAATQVVLKRLQEAGLNDLCCAVHDAHADRTPTFRDIRQVVDGIPREPSLAGQWGCRTVLAGSIHELEGKLDDYAQAVRLPHSEIGLAYRHLLAEEQSLYQVFPTLQALPELRQLAENLSDGDIRNAQEYIETTGCRFHDADPFCNPWRYRRPEVQRSPSFEAELQESIAALRALDDEHLRLVKTKKECLALPADLDSFEPAAQLLIAALKRLTDDTKGNWRMLVTKWLVWLNAASPEHRAQRASQCARASRIAQEARESPHDLEVTQFCKELDPEERTKLSRSIRQFGAWKDSRWSFLSMGYHLALRRLKNAQQQLERTDLGELALALERALGVQALLRELVSVSSSLVPGVRPASQGEEAVLVFAQIAEESKQQAEWLHDACQVHTWATPVQDLIAGGAQPPDLASWGERLRKALERLPAAREVLAGLGRLEAHFPEEGLREPRAELRTGGSITAWLKRLSSGLANLDALTYIDNERVRAQALHGRLLNLLAEYERQRQTGGPLPSPPDMGGQPYGRWWYALVRYAAIQSWKVALERQNPVLTEFTPQIYEDRRRRLREALDQKRDLDREFVRDTWRRRRSLRRDVPWKRIFQMRRSRNGEAKRMREAIHLGLESGLLDLKPCWLVDPSVACELLPLKPGLFDVVIFDEASQCPVEYAVPAIYRGRRLVITGDEKQLPPTSFFLPTAGALPPVGADDTAPDTQTEATDKPVQQRVRKVGIQAVMQTDELLTAAIDLGALPEERLRVHYRSEHPDLIRFSNHAFYGGDLDIPPVPEPFPPEAARPIVYVPVNGQYNKERTNDKEAQRVVDILAAYWLDHPSAPTIGVVTFNAQQRDLIEDLLRQRCGTDPAFEARYREETQRRESNLDVGFFIKNLENVQGDERDVMIFSMTFGRGADGKFYRRFGPVGAEHGERRLNVAVTRAKKRNIVLNSMPVEEISPALSQSGVIMGGLTPKCYLQLYLAYAKAVWEGDADQVSRLCRALATPGGPHADGPHDPESPLEEDVASEIERMGFQVEYQVGESGFRIDIGVSHGQTKGRYLLGVECDGASFHGNWSARHRDVWRENILRSRGWPIHRVWSTSWWYHRAEEVAKLQAALDDAMRVA